MADAKSRKPLVIGAAVVAALLVMCCCSGTLGMYFMGKQNLDARAESFAGLSAACRGEPVPGAAAVTVDGAIHAQAYDEDGDMLHYWLPSEMRSEGLADTEVVVCRVGDWERYTVERCDYETGFVTGLAGGENVILREGYRQRFRVVVAQTGQTLAEELVEGEPPETCPENAEFDTGGETDRFVGDTPDGEEVGAWMRTLAL